MFCVGSGVASANLFKDINEQYHDYMLVFFRILGIRGFEMFSSASSTLIISCNVNERKNMRTGHGLIIGDNYFEVLRKSYP